MAQINTALSADDISRLIDGLEGTAHLDEEPIDQDRTDQLLSRLVCLFDQVMKQELQPVESSDDTAIQEIADLLFS